MMTTTRAAMMALLFAGVALPAVAQTMQPTTQTAQDQTANVTPEQAAPAPDQAAPAAGADQTKAQTATRTAHVRKAHHIRHRHKTRAVTQARANAGDMAKTDAKAAPADAGTAPDGAAQK